MRSLADAGLEVLMSTHGLSVVSLEASWAVLSTLTVSCEADLLVSDMVVRDSGLKADSSDV